MKYTVYAYNSEQRSVYPIFVVFLRITYPVTLGCSPNLRGQKVNPGDRFRKPFFARPPERVASHPTFQREVAIHLAAGPISRPLQLIACDRFHDVPIRERPVGRSTAEQRARATARGATAWRENAR